MTNFKHNTISSTLLMICAIFSSCIDEPNYLETKKSEFPEPYALWVKQIDAFSLELNWKVPTDNYELADGFLIESFADSDNINISYFDSIMNGEKNKQRTIVLMNSDSELIKTVENDTTNFIFIDDSVSFDNFNFYRVTIINDDVEAYSVTSDNGFYFTITNPDSFKIEQQNDYQLKLSWQNSEFADGYKIERTVGDGGDTIVFSLISSTMIDSSFTPSYDILIDSVYSVSGIQPNEVYFYKITAYGDKEGHERRWSGPTFDYGKISLNPPILANTMPINDSTVRLYFTESSFDSAFDSLFVLKREFSEWEFADTFLFSSIDQIKYNINYLIDVTAESEADYRLVTKGKVNALSSKIVSGEPLEIAGFTYIEGGDFRYGSFGAEIDTAYFAYFYFSIFEFTGLGSFPPMKGDFPIDSISWFSALSICSTLTADPKYDYTFRLPSEEEWEYAAKWDIFEDVEYTYPWQSNSITGNNANYINSGDQYDNKLTPTGYFDGNNGTIDSFSPFGIYDMGGNVLEWCGSGKLEDDLVDTTSTNKAMRGGSYWHAFERLKTTERFLYDPKTDVAGFGFRIVMEIK